MLLTFCEGQFPDRFVTSIQGDYRDQTITVDNLKTKLQIYDTAGMPYLLSASIRIVQLNNGEIIINYY